MRCWRTWSNSIAENDGSRSISAARRSAPAQFASTVCDASRVDAVAAAAVTMMLRLQPVHLVLDLLARLVLGAAHQHGAGQAAPPRTCRTAISRRRNAGRSRATTVPPRVCLGSSTSFIPLASLARTTRFSMLAGVGSNTSPGGDRRAALVILEQRRQVGRGGHLGAVRALRRE